MLLQSPFAEQVNNSGPPLVPAAGPLGPQGQSARGCRTVCAGPQRLEL